MTKEVQSLLRARDTAFRSGDTSMYSTAQADLKRGIKNAKWAYKKKVEDHFLDNDPRRVWQGIQHITNYKGSSATPTNTNASLAEELNCFFARFEANISSLDSLTPPVAGSCALTLQEHEVKRALVMVNPKKAAGPDGVPGKVLKVCADQLCTVFTNIFNLSLAQAIVPPCLKSAVIIPVPKKHTIDSLNDYRPVALTPITMKCFERLVLKHLLTSLPPAFDQHQFAYRQGRSTEDTIAIALHSALDHLSVGAM